jgi:hypothetical protein
MSADYGGELRVSNVFERPRPDRWAPDLRQQPVIADARHVRQILHVDTHLAMFQEIVEHLVAGARRWHLGHQLLVEAILRELFLKNERAHVDARDDVLELHASAAKVRLARRAHDRRPVSFALELEVELNSIVAERRHAAA